MPALLGLRRQSKSLLDSEPLQYPLGGEASCASESQETRTEQWSYQADQAKQNLCNPKQEPGKGKKSNL